METVRLLSESVAKLFAAANQVSLILCACLCAYISASICLTVSVFVRAGICICVLIQWMLFLFMFTTFASVIYISVTVDHKLQGQGLFPVRTDWCFKFQFTSLCLCISFD